MTNCIICNQPLTDPQSIEIGMGPKCREKAIMNFDEVRKSIEEMQEAVKHLPGQHTQSSHGRRAAGGVGAANDATSVTVYPKVKPQVATKRAAAIIGSETKRMGANNLAKELGIPKSNLMIKHLREVANAGHESSISKLKAGSKTLWSVDTKLAVSQLEKLGYKLPEINWVEE